MRSTLTKCPISNNKINKWKDNASNLLNISGGSSVNVSMKKTIIRKGLGVWGVLQVLAILGNALKRLFPIAIQPFIQSSIKLSPFNWFLYITWSLYMAYTEGYKAFHLKFAPLVVNRSFHLHENISILNVLFAGPYSMGLFNADKKRMIVSWSITTGVFALVSIVKKLPYPYRSIVDAGVVVGLTVGTLSICLQALFALFGNIPVIDNENEKAK